MHIGSNKKKILFVLHTSKTLYKNMPPQMVKISSSTLHNTSSTKSRLESKGGGYKPDVLPCPYQLLRMYSELRGGYINNNEPYFIFRDRSPVTQNHFWVCLKLMLKLAGFQERFYRTHGLRVGRCCDLYNLGVTIETIKKISRWKSNAVFRYLKT